MTGLVVFDDERFRDATPAEIFGSAESLHPCRPAVFPHSFTVRTQQDAEIVGRWLASPRAMPQLLCVLVDEANEVTQYERLPLGASAEILQRLLDFTRPPYRVERIWVVFVQPEAQPDAADPLGEWLSIQMARQGCESFRYLRIAGNQLPSAHGINHCAIQTPFLVPEHAGHRPATPQEVFNAAEVLCARRLERGQVLSGSMNSKEALQLSVTPLTQSSFGIALLDANCRFLDYRNICAFDSYFCEDAGTVMKDWQTMAEQAQAMLATGGILVRAHSGPRLPLNDSEEQMIQTLIPLLCDLNITTHACAVVGTNGMEIYNTYRVISVEPPSVRLH